MTIFDVLSLIGGLSLFLFGMNVMGNALEKKAGGSLKTMLGKMTSTPLKGFLLGTAVTAVIQSSSATTVMVVGFVNSGLMTLHQSVGIIMGANVGTTVTAWLISLMAVDGSGIMAFFKPSSFVPVLAIIGVGITMFSKKVKLKDTAMILLGFATLMTGMDIMSDAVAGLKEVPEFTRILTIFSNPVLGVLAGAFLTAIIQSSSASVGILQALSTTGAVAFNTAFPVIMGMSIGTCITAVISAVGANKNAKRATLVHLYFNIIGTVVGLALFYGVDAIVGFDFLEAKVGEVEIAIMLTSFKVFCVLMWAPAIRLLEKMATVSIRDTEEKEKYEVLDERLFATPAVAVDQSRTAALSMAEISVESINKAIGLLDKFNEKDYDFVMKAEKKTDKYEDKIGSYLVKVSALELSPEDSMETSKLLHIIGDFERISDHAVSVLKSAEEMGDKKLVFSGDAGKGLSVMTDAVKEIVNLAYLCFRDNDKEAAKKVEPLEQVVDDLKAQLKRQHIERLRKGECTIEHGFVFGDILTNLERVADHCSNIAGCVTEMAHNEMDMHSYVKKIKKENLSHYNERYEEYKEKYSI